MTSPTLPGMLGRNPADPARLARTIRLRFTGTTPPHPITADHLAQVRRWMLGGNDRFGTCGPTAVANSAVLTWKYLLGQDITVTDEAVWDLYRRSGNPDFNPDAQPDANGNVPGDGGVDMTVMLAELVKNGIDITHADGRVERVKPVCFAAHDTGMETVRAVTSIFGFDIFGYDMQVAQQTARVWDYVAGSPEWGGHAVIGGRYTSASSGVDETDVSWASLYGTTDAFVSHQLGEGYVVVWEPVWDFPVFQAGVDRAALAADYSEFTGRTFPVPVSPPPAPAPPAPAPAPPAPPVPGPVPVPPVPAPVPPVPDVHADAADRRLVADMPPHWEDDRHVGENGRAAKAYAKWREAKSL